MTIKRILHIDDERYEVNGIKVALCSKEYEYKVDQFSWPSDAEDPDKEGCFTILPVFTNYDLILLDIIMGPGCFGLGETNKGYTTGLVLHRELIKPKLLHIPVFFISALPDGPFQRKARQYADENKVPFIRKSVDTVTEIVRHIKIIENNENKDLSQEAQNE